MPLDPWMMNTGVSDGASARLTVLQGGLPSLYDPAYPSPSQHQQSLSLSLPPTTATAPPAQRSPVMALNMAPGPSSHHEQDDETAAREPGQAYRAWGGAGSLDPATGVFSRAADHPRIRTAQACEKCRARKAKVRLRPLIPPYTF
ncbi:hypothetical protein BC834DRAFT_858889 [Gloeopeniophorella convolvens]|nr:hypothetical protein BC834DRAFT_858889 [Gloeopeniophorella convolvens]